jgi:hypothetical protein
MVKLRLAGRNLSRVNNFRHGCTFTPPASSVPVKLPNLKWKTRPKQLLGLDFVLRASEYALLCSLSILKIINYQDLSKFTAEQKIMALTSYGLKAMVPPLAAIRGRLHRR